MKQVFIEDIKEKIQRWCKVLFRFGDYVLIKLERPEFVFGVGNIDFEYAIESTANDIFFYVFNKQIYEVNERFLNSKSQAMEDKLRELGYDIRPNIGFARELSKDTVATHCIDPHKLFIIEKADDLSTNPHSGLK